MIRDERGAAVAEMAVVFPVVFTFFLGTYMLAYLFAADLIVERSASAAARAASVYMADSATFYTDHDNRLGYVREAARRVLFASPALDPESVRVTLTGQESGASMLTANVHANFECGVFIVSFLCGLDHRVVLHASASMPYQGP
jgi:Flp pilus assembly protein TadG